MSCIVIPQGHLCVSRTFKAGDPEPDGYMDRIAWHKAQGRAGLRQKRCSGCSRWFYPFQEHGCAPAPDAAKVKP